MAIEDDAGVSQRKLSSDIGIAVGSVNWYLKRCISKGLVKLQQAPVKRYLYYLTPQGFDEKARLTASFFQSSFELYRAGRKECVQFFSDCAAKGFRRILLAGDGDFAEIAVLSSFETPLRAEGVIDSRVTRDICAGVPIHPTVQAAVAAGGPPDAILLTDLRNPKAAYSSIRQQVTAAGLGDDLVHVPRLLNVRRDG